MYYTVCYTIEVTNEPIRKGSYSRFLPCFFAFSVLFLNNRTLKHSGLNILKNQSFYFHGYTKAPSQRFAKKANSTRNLMLLPKTRQMPMWHAAAAACAWSLVRAPDHWALAPPVVGTRHDMQPWSLDRPLFRLHRLLRAVAPSRWNYCVVICRLFLMFLNFIVNFNKAFSKSRNVLWFESATQI